LLAFWSICLLPMAFTNQLSQTEMDCCRCFSHRCHWSTSCHGPWIFPFKMFASKKRHKTRTISCHSIRAESMIHYCRRFASNAPSWFIVALLRPL
jgi:hypothetical protein